MKIVKIFWSAVLLTGTLCARELFVSSSGNDKNPGTAQAPFATIGKAASVVQPGDTVKIGPGLYREQITFKRSGKKDAPVVFAGTRGPKGEFLTIAEPPGFDLDKWTPAPEIGPCVWKAPLAKRPDLVLMDGMRIVFINAKASELPPWPKAPSVIDEDMIWAKLGPGSKRLPGLNYLQLPSDVRMDNYVFKGRKEVVWPVIGYVLSSWYKGFLYVRFANGDTPEMHRFSAASGEGFTIFGASHLVFRDLFLRGSRVQLRVAGGSCNTIEKSLLMHGSVRVAVEKGSRSTTIRECILTSGFIRGDYFQLRTNDDMRGGVLYRFFKNIMGTGHSDDVGVADSGTGTRILDNVICKGLIGMDAYGPGVEVAGNVVRDMSSVGICTGSETSGKIHHNLVMNCGIPLRLQNYRHVRANRLEYYYNNLVVQARNGGGFVYVHSVSFETPADRVNFDKKVNSRGRTVYTYKKDPPDPVDGGKFYFYHNTFWGGSDQPPFSVTYLRNRFRQVQPFFVVNNIYRDSAGLNTATHELTGPNVLYTFDKDIPAAARVDAAVAKVNKVVSAKAAGTIWNKNDIPGLPDVSLAPGSPALETGIDVSRPFMVKGKTCPALPGFSPGYFKGKAPAAGAFQEGESMARFIAMYRRSEEALKMISGLKKSTVNDSDGGKK